MSQHLQNCPAPVSMSAFIPKYPQRGRRRLQQDPVCAQCTVVGLQCSSCTVCRRAAPVFTAHCCTCRMSTGIKLSTEVTGLNQMSIKWNFRPVLCNSGSSWCQSGQSGGGGCQSWDLVLHDSMNHSRQTHCYQVQVFDLFTLSSVRSYFEIKSESDQWS